MYRLRAGILKAKQLKKLKLEEKLKAITRFAEKYIGKYYKLVTKKYFIKDYHINIIKVY